MSDSRGLERLLNREVVLDVSSAYLYLGTLVHEEEKYLVLKNADVHDMRETQTTRELYTVEAKRHGISSNRKRVYVRKEEVVSVSALEDVID